MQKSSLVTAIASVLAIASTATAQQAAPGAESAATELEEVIVTAQRRTENLQNVPIAITAVSADRVEALHATRLTDLAGVAPGLVLDRGSANDTVTLRGVGGGGRNIGFGSRAGVYLDGVYIGQSTALNQPMLDIERIEVLRGPQGTLFGRNTVSGAVSIITRPPEDDFHADLVAATGNQDYQKYSVVANAPLGTDKLLGKFSFVDEQRDGFTKNLYNGDHVIGSLDLQSWRAALRAQPTDALTLDLIVDDTQDDSFRSGPESISTLTGGGTTDPNAPKPFETNTNTRRIKEGSNKGVNFTVNYSLPVAATLTSITAYRESRLFVQADNDYSPVDFVKTDYHDAFDQFSQELRLASDQDGRMRWVAGVFFLDEQADTHRDAGWGAAAPLLGLGLAANSITPADASIDTRSYAVFGSFDYDFTDRWTLNTGLRYTDETRDLRFDLDGSTSGLIGIATLDNFHDDASEDHWTPVVGLTFKASDDVNLYVRYSEGFKSGGWNVDFLNRNQIKDLDGNGRVDFAFLTETVTSYELGVKAEMLDRRLRANVAAFQSDYQDYQINSFVHFPGGVTVIQLTNAAKVETKGVELSLEAVPVEGLLLTLDAAYIDAKFDKFPGGGAAGTDASGNQLPFAPEWSGSISAQYSVPITAWNARLELFGQYAYRDPTYAGQENLPTQELGARNLTNARVSLEFAKRWGITVWGNNVFEDSYLTNQTRDFFGTRFVERGDPRTYGLELSARF
jgi:iron complex outermembrane receptor protein